MTTVNTKPIFVDFGNADGDGSIRLITNGTVQALRDQKIELRDGIAICISDGESTAEATTFFREGMWVASINTWLMKEVEAEATEATLPP